MDDAQEELRVTRMAVLKDLDDEKALDEAYGQNVRESQDCESELTANIEKQIELENAQLPTHAPQVLTSRTSGGRRDELSFERDLPTEMQYLSISSKLWGSCARSPRRLSRSSTRRR